MIRLKDVRIEGNQGKALLKYNYTENSIKKTLWYEVDTVYKKYLIDELADAFVVVFINYAMLNNLDIQSEIPISSRLYYNLVQHYIPTLVNNNNNFNNISLDIPHKTLMFTNEGKVGTGMSGGVDSFATFLLNSNIKMPQEYRVNQLTFFNVGAIQSSNYPYYDMTDILEFKNKEIVEKSLKLNEKRFMASLSIAENLNMPLIRVESNILEVQKSIHEYLHTQRTISAVLILQKYFSKYYFASTLPLEHFKISHTISHAYDVFSLNMFSTDNVTFYPGDIAYNRVQKTEIISQNSVVQSKLNVCWREVENCGVCDKCLRTLVTLDYLNILDSFSKVFDIQKYYRNKNKYLGYMKFMSNKDRYFKEIFEFLDDNNLDYKTKEFYINYFKVIVKRALKKTQLILTGKLKPFK